jgi:uncharacterized DUF497 family protein
VRIVWNEAKRASNLRKHGVDFAAVEHFDWDSAVFISDDVLDSEVRHRALGFIGLILCALVFTATDEELRVISLRKATRHEAQRYAEEIERQEEKDNRSGKSGMDESGFRARTALARDAESGCGAEAWTPQAGAAEGSDHASPGCGSCGRLSSGGQRLAKPYQRDAVAVCEEAKKGGSVVSRLLHSR